MNKSLPPISILVRNEFLYNHESGFGEYTKGHLVSVRALQNQALQFSVLLETGALFTGLPANSLCFIDRDNTRSLLDCQMWDNISSTIDVVVLETLRYMKCSVKLEDSKDIVTGNYLFTIDYVGENDLSRNPEHWKQLHAIELEEGNFCLYPQYRIKFLDSALCPKQEDFPDYKVNNIIWTSGS